MKTKKIICLYGGPGTGKSTTCAELYSLLKKDGFSVEMNREYVKEWVWEKRDIIEGDQSYFFAKQARKERIYIKQNMDFIITDSPLILTHFYGMKYDPFEQKYNTSLTLLKHHHGFCKDHGYKIDHFFLNRAKAYSPAGRYQDEQTAISYDIEIRNLLISFGIKFREVHCDIDAAHTIKNILGTL